MALLSHISADVDRSYPSRFHPRGHRQRISEFSRENAGRQLSTSLIAAGENLAGHPHRRLIEGAISFWRAGAAQFRQGLFGCDTAFGIGRAVPGAFLVSIAANTNASDAAIGGLCTACFHAKNDVELDAVAVRMLRRLTSPRCRWLDPLPSRYGNEARHPPLWPLNPQGIRQ